MMPKIKPVWVLWGLGAGAALIALNSLLSGRIASGTAAAVGRLPSDIVIGGAEGLFGLPDPRTAESVSRCDAARAAGDDWSASFYCPASSWIRGLFDGK